VLGLSFGIVVSIAGVTMVPAPEIRHDRTLIIAAGRTSAVSAASHSPGTGGPDRALGCLLGGAIGDALGAKVEFLSWRSIRARFGPFGVTDLVTAYGKWGAVTDDTQMTLFTAEGLIEAFAAGEPDDAAIVAAVYRAYQRWLRTQTEAPPGPAEDVFAPGSLLAEPELWASRSPGNTCLSALRSERCGTPEQPFNHSKGSGGIMRVAPVGLIGARLGSPERCFELGVRVAAITHGHPSGYLSAGAFALMVAELAAGQGLLPAVADALAQLRRWPGHEETQAAIEAALVLAAQGTPTPATLEQLGSAWIGPEALALALYCALAAADCASALLAAVNHSGDSDTTGALVGNLLGALHGVQALPPRWCEVVELAPVVHVLAQRLGALNQG